MYDQGVTQIVRFLNRTISTVYTYVTAVRLSSREQVIFFKRLGMMLHADMPITSALQLIAVETKNQQVRKLLQTVARDVSAGISLSVALQTSGSNFASYSINIIAIGEVSGTLAKNLEYLAVELKKKHDLRAQILGSLVYPAIVFIATIGITIFLLVYIFPKIVPIFLSLKTDLPFSTRVLMEVSDWLLRYGWLLLASSVLLLGLLPVMLQVPVVRRGVDFGLLQLPIFGRLCQYYNLATILRTLGLLLQNGVRINEALGIVAQSTENVVYKKALHTTCTRVIIGKTLASSYQEYPQLWPVLVVQMVQAGEATGTLASTCGYLSEMYESDSRDAMRIMTVLLEPLLMLFMGLCVGFIAVSIITPIYGITAQLHS